MSRLRAVQMVEMSKLYWSRAALLALAMTTLGRAVQVHDGALGTSPYPAIIWLTIAIIIVTAAVFSPKPLPIGPREFKIVVTICLLANLVQLATRSPDPLLHIDTYSRLAPCAGGLAASAFFCGLVLAGEKLGRALAFIGLLIAVALVGGWAIENCPNPRIDVFVFQTDAADALAEGQDPYGITSVDIYPDNLKYYGEGLVRDGRVQFGYPYLPETLLAIMPARLLHFDLRYAQLAAVVLTALLLVAASPTMPGFCAAMLFVTTPTLLLVLEKSWVEPFCVLGLAATVACAIRWPRVLPLALGLFLASKQYMLIAVFLFFVCDRPLRRTAVLLVQAAVVAIVLTLPLAMWNLSAFWNSAIQLQFRQPFRTDALSYLAWIGAESWPRAALVAIPFGALLFTVSLSLWRRKAIGFAAALAVCLLIFFALSKQAFANYYFFVIGAMACGIVELTPGIASTISMSAVSTEAARERQHV
jgi:hypothetical protein